MVLFCYFCLNTELVLLLSSLLLRFPVAAMASLTWSFGPDGFSVRVTNEEGATSVVSGATPMDELAIKVTPLTGDPSAILTESAVAPMLTSNDWGPLPRVRERKVVIRTPVQIEIKGDGSNCETSLNAMWVLTPNSISGKGSGKGMGKSIRIEPIND